LKGVPEQLARQKMMYLKQNKIGDRIHLVIAHGYRDKDTKKVRTKTIKTLGYLDELEKQYPDPIAHFKAVVAEMNRQEAEGNPAVSIALDRNERLTAGQDNRKNIGYAAISKIYHGLGLHTFFSNHARAWEVEYNTNSIMRLLIFSRILAPASKKKTYEQRGIYFEKMDFTLSNVYRCLDKVSALKKAVTVHLHKQMMKMYGRSDELVYYDVTNYYFEIDEQDEMRRKGVSKEHRPDPIIQMGLLTDSSGIPITYNLFPGNTNDCETYVPIFKEVRRDFDLGRIIVVADKGLNTGDNIAYCKLSGNGYVFSQTVRGASKELVDYVFDTSDYRIMDAGFKIKSRQHPRLIYVTNDEGKKKTARVHEKQVVFYSPDYDKRAKAERAAAVAKARELVSDPTKYKRATSYGAAKYVRNLVFDEQTGEILTTKQKPSFDDDKLREEEMFDGYYAIVTSEWQESDERILDIYRGLWQIEEAFRVCKSDLEFRPVFLSLQDRIDAHFLVCFIALVIARLLTRSLGNKFSVSKIAESLAKASGSFLDHNWYLFDYADDVTQSVLQIMGLDLGRKYMSLREIKHLIGDSKKPLHDV